MAYVNKQNLSDFWTNAKRYIAARGADQCDWASVPVNAPIYRFEAEQHTPVNPVIEFGFTETPPAEGEKSPTNPSTITGVDSITVTRCGKNLCPHNILYNNQSNVTITANADGSFTFNGTATGDLYAMLFNGTSSQSVFPKFLNKGSTYSLSLIGNDQNIKFRVSIALNNAWSGGVAAYVGSGQTAKITIPSNATGCLLRFEAASGTVFNNSVVKAQLELGSTATSFEPYSGAETTISLGSTQYGGTLDVATGVMTVTHYSVTPTRSVIESATGESVSDAFNFAVYDFRSGVARPSVFSFNESYGYNASNYFCNYYAWERSGGVANTFHFSSNFVYLSVSGSSAENAKQLLLAVYDAAVARGNPIIFVYPLASPITVQLDPVQLTSLLNTSHVNTVYTDTGTITQLTYAKPAPRQEDFFRYANWHKTETAKAVTCCPVPESELHPVVNFSFTETPPASGDKGPDNPSTITGVNKINLYKANKNILAVSDFRATATIKNATWTNNGDGSISVTRSSAGDGTSFYDMKGLYNALEYFPAGTYTFTRGGEASNVRFALSTADTNIVTILGSDVTKTFTLEEGMYLHFYAYLYQNDEASNVVVRPQLEFSPEASSFETGISDTYQVSFGSTYYGGSIDLSTGLMTVTHEKLTFDGNTTFATSGFAEYNSTYKLQLTPVPARGMTVSASDAAADTLPTFVSSPGDSAGFYFPNNSSLLHVVLPKTDVGAVAGASQSAVATAFNSWFEEHPTSLVFPIAVPFTVQLTPQQIKALPALDKYSYRVNTLYTDADSIQVGYMKSPIKTEEEFNNAILALGGNL